MALVTRLQNSQNEITNDITRNLLSLQFESALNEEEKELLVLRARTHAVSVTQCALATVTVDILRKARELQLYPEGRRATRILQGENDKDSLIVGIVGCGRLGSQIAHCLLTYGQLHPSKLQISTRRPETLEYLQHRGVECYFNNIRLVSSAHVVFYCVLPSQMTAVSEEIKDYVPSSLIHICPFSSLNLKRLRQMLGSSTVIRPVLHWSLVNPDPDYNHSVNVNTALENRATVEGTCPLALDKSKLVVSTDERLAETIILAVVNMCSDCGFSCAQTLTIIHSAVFGETQKKPLTCDRLTCADFGLYDTKDGTERSFPFFDLVDVHEESTPCLARLLGNESIRSAFLARYCHLFQDYLHKKAYGQLP